MQQIALDANRLLKPTQRRFNAAWLESVGDSINVMPQVAAELTHGKFVVDPHIALQQARETLRLVRERGDTQVAFIVECDIWWLSELIDDASPYRLLALSRDEYAQASEIREALPSKAFPEIPKEDIPSESDAVIISQALVKSQNLLITSNMKSLRHNLLNEWICANSNQYGINSQPLIFVQDEIMPRLFVDREEELLYITLGASWPDQVGASDSVVIDCFKRHLNAMREGALLANTAALVERRWREMSTDTDVLLSYVRANYLPEQTRRSEARHPGSRPR